MMHKKIHNRIFALAISGVMSLSMLVPSLAVLAEETEMAEAVEAVSQQGDGESNISLEADENIVTDSAEEDTDMPGSENDGITDGVSEEGTSGNRSAGSFQDEPSGSDDSSDGNSNDIPDQDVPTEGEAKNTDDTSAEPSEITDDATDNVATQENDSVEEDTGETSVGEASWHTNSDDITVTAKAKSGALPDGAELKADRIYSDSVGEALDEHGTDYDGYVAVDIYFLNGDDRIEPDGNVTITFEAKDVIPEGVADVEVKHFDESGESLKVVTVADTGDSSDGSVSVDGTSATAEFEVSSFSTFAIVWKQEGGWPETSYINVNCKDQYGNLLTNEFVPSLIVVGDQETIALSADNDKLKIPSVGSGTTATTYTFTSAEAIIKGETTISSVKSISAAYSKSEARWLYTVTYDADGLESKISELTSDQISLTLYYSCEDTSLVFSTNGGSGTTPPVLTGKGGTKVTLPNPDDYGIARSGYTFIGWSEVSSLKQDTSFHEVYEAGDEYYLPASGSKTLYAAWTSTTYGNVNFYIRLDAKVAPEPTQYGNALYTSGVYIANTAKEQRWIIDMDAANHDGVHVQNDVSNNMTTLPTAAQLKSVINGKSSSIGFSVDVNSDGRLYVSNVTNTNNTLGVEQGDLLYVHWYVQKWANGNGYFWNVDGVLLTEKTIEITYHGNPNGTDIGNLPAGYSVDPGTDVTVGVTGAASADSSHSLLYTTKTGYELVGWNTEPDGTGTTYKVGDVFRPTKDTTLYAMWSKIPRGNLKITKQITGDIGYGDSGHEYTIRVLINSAWVNRAETATKYSSITDETGTAIGSNVFTGETTDAAGQTWKYFDIALKDGESVLISGIYDSTIFKIEEIDSTGAEITYDGYDQENLSNNRIETNVTKYVTLRNGISVVETGVNIGNIHLMGWIAVIMFGCFTAFAYRTLKRNTH